MELTITLAEGDGSHEDLLVLRQMLVTQPDFEGMVRSRNTAPEPGKLGTLVEAIIITMPPILLSSFTAIAIAWLRHRSGQVSIHIRTESGAEVTVDGPPTTAMNAEQLRELAVQIAEQLSAAAGPARRPRALPGETNAD